MQAKVWTCMAVKKNWVDRGVVLAAILLFAICLAKACGRLPSPGFAGRRLFGKVGAALAPDDGQRREKDHGYPYYPETKEKALTVYNQVPEIGTGSGCMHDCP